jgi:hypothetical protein
MFLFFKHHPILKLKEESLHQNLVSLPEHEHNTNEGSEFLDDAIRMEDLPEVFPGDGNEAGIS